MIFLATATFSGEHVKEAAKAFLALKAVPGFQVRIEPRLDMQEALLKLQIKQ